MTKIFKISLILVNLLILIKILSVTNFFSPLRYQPDFDTYYHLVSDMRRGINPYTVPYMQTFGPPLVFIYYYPFSIFSLHNAQTINLIINLISGYTACYLLALAVPLTKLQMNTGAKWGIFNILFFGSFLSRFSLQLGQLNLFITLLITIIVTTPKFRTFFLISLFTVKTLFFLPLITQPKYIFKNSLFVLFIILYSLFIIHPNWYFTYLNRLPKMNFTSITEPLTDNEYYNQSLRSTGKRLNLSIFYTPVYLALIFFAIYLSLTTYNLQLTILLSLLISPVLWQHYFIWLFPIFLITFKQLYSHRLPMVLLSVTALLWYPDLRLHEAPVTNLNRLLSSHFYFALIILIIIIICHAKNHSNPHLN